MIRRFIVGLLLACVTSAGIVFGGMSQAHAAPLCATPPKPAGPKEGISGLLTKPPATPVTGDPFAEENPAAIHDVYGTSWRYTLYDLGCIPDPTGGDVISRFDAGNATLVMDLASVNIAVLSLLERLVKESSMGWLFDWVGEASAAIRPIVLGGGGIAFGLLPLALLVTAIWVGWLARRGDLSTIGTQVVVVVVSFMLAQWTLTAPAVATRATDGMVRSVATIGGSAFNASLTDGVNRNSVYRAWLAGTFGDADSDVAKTYGPRLLEATHFTWQEWDRVQNDPEAMEKLTSEKGDRFKELASELKENHSGQIYDSFTGKSASRSGPAFYAAGVGLLMAFFALIALSIVLVARFLMLGLVVAAPIGSIMGVLPNGQRTLWAMWSMFFACLLNVFKFSLAGGLMATLMGHLMRTDPVSAVVWMVVATVAFFVVLKPFRSFKTMVPGMDPNRSYIKDLGKLVGKLAVGAVTGGAAGAAAGAAVAEKRTEPPAAADSSSTGGVQRVDLRTPSAIPAPTFRQLPDNPGPAPVEPGGPPAPPRPQIGGGPSRWEGVAPVKPLPPAPPPAAPAPAAAADRTTTLRMDKPIVVTPGQETVQAAGAVDQSQVVIQGHVVSETGHYIPHRQSKIESLAEARSAKDSNRQIELYVPNRTA